MQYVNSIQWLKYDTLERTKRRVSIVSELSLDRLSLTTEPAALKFFSLLTLVAGIGSNLSAISLSFGYALELRYQRQ